MFEPASWSVIVEGDATTGGFKKILVLVLGRRNVWRRPDSRATFKKENAEIGRGSSGGCSWSSGALRKEAGIHEFGAPRRALSRAGSTIAERLSDWRNGGEWRQKNRYLSLEPRARIRALSL